MRGSGRAVAIGVQDRGEDLDTFDDPRTRSNDERIGVDRPHLGMRRGVHRGRRLPSANSVAPSSRKPHGATITTSHAQAAISSHVAPWELCPGRPITESTAGGHDHVGHPVPVGERRIGPLEQQRRSCDSAIQLGGNGSKAIVAFVDDHLGLRQSFRLPRRPAGPNRSPRPTSSDPTSGSRRCNRGTRPRRRPW